MMTIKVIQHKMVGEKIGRSMTHLYEGGRVRFEFIDFENKNDFLEKYKNLVEGIEEAHVTGIPEKYWGDKEIEPNTFLCIYYNKGDKLERCIILQNSIVYIMQGGQTIDTIHC